MNQVTAFIIKYKWVIIAIIVLLIIIYIAYRQGKSYRPGAVKLPPDIQGNSGNSGGGLFDPTQYTDDIWTDIDCIFCFHDPAPYNKALTLSNTQLVAIWNDWNRRYYEKAGNKNFCQSIDGEGGYTSSQAWYNAARTLHDRFISLGLCS